jgi:hypothetical protein
MDEKQQRQVTTRIAKLMLECVNADDEAAARARLDALFKKIPDELLEPTLVLIETLERKGSPNLAQSMRQYWRRQRH